MKIRMQIVDATQYQDSPPAAEGFRIKLAGIGDHFHNGNGVKVRGEIELFAPSRAAFRDYAIGDFFTVTVQREENR